MARVSEARGAVGREAGERASGAHLCESSQSALRASLGLSQRWGLSRPAGDSMVPAHVGDTCSDHELLPLQDGRDRGAARACLPRQRWRRVEIGSSTQQRAALPAESMGQAHSELAQTLVVRARAAHSQSIAEDGLSQRSGGSTEICEKRSRSGWRGSSSSSASPESMGGSRLIVSSSTKDAVANMLGACAGQGRRSKNL